MMIEKPLYIHINKCGGTSITHLLHGATTHRHETLSTSVLHYEHDFVFSFIRNPFDRLASMYRYRYGKDQHRLKKDKVSFYEWFHLAVMKHELPYYNNPILFLPAIEWLLIDGQISADFIGKVETFNEDWKVIAKLLKIDKGPIQLNKSDSSIPTPYDYDMKQFVRIRYKHDLKFYE